MCFMPIFSDLHFLSTIFFLHAPPPPSKKNEDLFLYNFVVKNVFCQFINIYI